MMGKTGRNKSEFGMGVRIYVGIARNTREGACATLTYFAVAALPSSLASIAGLEQTS
jgi:hypothetical protein